ncbi:HNH endonuclease [Streptomyces sp. NBC_00564]|uniref:HNH endonuclease signature motif containing protein n=1 Tax=Streptomyces sp. NBC_00564 TaxID=2903663 RepID=UPI00352C9011|nr:HNH endonuclease [Streptomyces sp. NBC_00564]
MPDSNRKTPSDVARRLRQHARFGCCRCGLPVYQYHHIIPYSQEQHFRVEDMMILCPLCHDMATKGALNDKEQREIQASPFNVRKGLAQGTLHVNQSYCAIVAGGIILVGEGPVIAVSGEPLISIRPGETGELLLSVTLYSEEGSLIAEIVDNEWISGDPSVWDMESDHQKLTIRSAPYKVALNLDIRGEPAHMRAKLWHAGYLIDLRGAGIRVNGKNAGQEISNLALAGGMLELDTSGPLTKLKLGPQREQRECTVISEPDREVRLRKTIEAWKVLNGEPHGTPEALRG